MNSIEIDTSEEQADSPRSINSVLIGALIGFREDGRVPLVLYPGQPGSAALPAATTVDVHGSHIGRQVVLLFENGDPRRPLIVGLLRSERSWPISNKPAEVEVHADGERLVISAKELLVLRCGRASITLTAAGKVLIDGAYISNRSSGVVRIKGGAVQIN
ncbi:MAG TPA: DUF6484 domain-containing protein [Steroidobacteraceae bacterium]|nr:DUF6484 domain-containing protein [Steroidobacteraceae bacterium]